MRRHGPAPSPLDRTPAGRTAENLNKQILCGRLEEGTGQDLISEWQRVDLFGAGLHTCIDVRGGPPVLLATEGPIRIGAVSLVGAV